ncbi:hypothetical protein L0F63_007412 [Massospora cicadina]|nr:hypothetical protein L0F63_007412 [Massospora cicadina]
MEDREDRDYPKLYTYESIDQPNEVEQILLVGFKTLSHLMRDKSEMELHNEIQAKASQSIALHHEMVHGLLYSILTLPKLAERHFQILSFTVRDSYAETISKLQNIAQSKEFVRLKDASKLQVVWVVGHLAELRVQGLGSLLPDLIRQIRSGDFSQTNLLFTEGLVEILNKNRKWVEQDRQLVAYSCYFFLRLIKDHVACPALQEKEVKYCLGLLRDKVGPTPTLTLEFEYCAGAGRELVRALHDVARVPEFREFWKVLLNEPARLGPKFEGVGSLLRKPTDRWFYEYRHPPDLTSKLVFLMSEVLSGYHPFYLRLFRKRHLPSPEAHVILPDLIRYICGAYHPSNAILASAVIQRFEVIGCLLKEVRDPVIAADCKLSLFYDWFFFDRNLDSIMNIEPGLLLMANSVDAHPYLSELLIEFLSFANAEYFPGQSELIHKGLDSAMELLLEKGVLRSLEPLYHSPNFSPETKAKLYALFGRFLGGGVPKPIAAPVAEGRPAPFPSPSQFLEYTDDEPIVPNFSPPEATEMAPIQGMAPAPPPPEPTPAARPPLDQAHPSHLQASPAHFQSSQNLPPHQPPQVGPPSLPENFQSNSGSSNQSQPDRGHPSHFQGFAEPFKHDQEPSAQELDASDEEQDERLVVFGDLFKELSAVVYDWTYDNKGILDSILEVAAQHGVEAEVLANKLERIFRRFDNYFIEISAMPQTFLSQLFPPTALKALSNGNEEDLELYDCELGIDFPAISIFETVWRTFFQNARGSLLSLERSPPADRELALLLVKLAAKISPIGPYWLVFTLREFASMHPDRTCPAVDPSCRYALEPPHPFRAYAHLVHLVSAETGAPPPKTVAADLGVLMELEKTAFYSLLPALYRFLPLWCVDNAELIRLAAEGLDSIQFTYTLSRIYCRTLNFMTREGLWDMIAESFNWSPVVQVNFWVFVIAQFGGDQEASEVILRAYLQFSGGEGLEDNSVQGEVIVKLSDILQRVPPSLRLLGALFDGCRRSVSVKRLGAWFVIMLSQWAQQWAPVLHANLGTFLASLHAGDLSALALAIQDEAAFSDDVIQWLKLLHCWCDPNAFPGTPRQHQGSAMLLSDPTTVELLKQLIASYQHRGLDPGDFPFFLWSPEAYDDAPQPEEAAHELHPCRGLSLMD